MHCIHRGRRRRVDVGGASEAARALDSVRSARARSPWSSARRSASSTTQPRTARPKASRSEPTQDLRRRTHLEVIAMTHDIDHLHHVGLVVHDMEEKNKALARKLFEEAWGKGNLAAVDEFIAADYVRRPIPTGQPPGPEGLKQAITTYRTAFPDLQVTVEDIFAEGD